MLPPLSYQPYYGERPTSGIDSLQVTLWKRPVPPPCPYSQSKPPARRPRDAAREWLHTPPANLGNSSDSEIPCTALASRPANDNRRHLT